MYLFTRTGRVRPGNTRESIAWAVGLTEKVKQITGLDVGLWTTMMSPRSGTLVWSTFVDSMTAIEEANAKLMTDDGFVAEADRGATLASPDGVDDGLAQLIHGEIDPSRRPSYAAVVQSALAPGGLAKGIEVGIEIAQRATQLGGAPTSFLVSATGTYGGVAWLTATESLEELERSEQAINADPEFVRYLDDVASGVYLQGVTTQVIYRRLT